MKKIKISKKLGLDKKEISKVSGINGGAIPVSTKTNNPYCFSRVDSCLCMTVVVCPVNQKN